MTGEGGNDIDAVAAAIAEAKADLTSPSMIEIKTQIGFGCPGKQGKASAHGEPLGDENIAEMKKNLNWPSEEAFFVPEEVYANYKAISEAKAADEEAWNKLFAEYCAKFPEMKKAWDDEFNMDIAKPLIDDADFWAYEDKPEATRNLSGMVINRLKDKVPGLVGGAADLHPSTKTSPQKITADVTSTTVYVKSR